VHVHAQGEGGVAAGEPGLGDDHVVQGGDAEAAELDRDGCDEVPAFLDRAEAVEGEAAVAVVRGGARADLGREPFGKRDEALPGCGSCCQFARHVVLRSVGGSSATGSASVR
jgi:hypothetical protein